MNLYYIFFIAFALGIDAFAVSFSAGAFFVKATKRQRFRLSFHFGLFQFFMPIIGWFAGKEIVKYIEQFDHWVALLILSIIGIKMISDTIKNDNSKIKKDISKGWTLISLSIATSIDALAVGFSLGLVKSDIILPGIIIGIIAAIMSLIGIKMGETLSNVFGQKISIFGGIILILIGIDIVLQHLSII